MVVLYVLARVPAAAVWLSIVLDVSAASGSYARAGGAVAAYGVGVALVSPSMGRAADRFGPRPVLLGCAAVQLPALLLLASVAASDGLTLLLPALVAGAVQPPLVPCMRAGWAVLVPDERSRQTCFSFDAVLGEVVDLGAPIIAVALSVARAETGGLRVVGIAVAATTALFAVAAPVAPRSPRAAPEVGRDGPRVLTRPVLAVLLVIALLTAGLGAVEVAVIAYADATGNRTSAGVLLSLFALGSIAGGLAYGRAGWKGVHSRQLLLLLAPLGAGLAATAVAPQSLWIAGPLLAVAGVSVAPLVAVLLGLLQAAAREGAVTETFTYATTANFLGVAGGSVLAGTANDAGAELAWLSTAAAGMFLAAVLVVLTAVAVVLVQSHLPATTYDRDVPEDLTAEAPAGGPSDDDQNRVAALVAELEQTWTELRETGRHNDLLVREIAELRSTRRAALAGVRSVPAQPVREHHD